jgi:hypothetical protein
MVSFELIEFIEFIEPIDPIEEVSASFRTLANVLCIAAIGLPGVEAFEELTVVKESAGLRLGFEKFECIELAIELTVFSRSLL